MNWLYYNGRFGEFERTKMLPSGTGPVNMVGTPCFNRLKKEAKDKHSHDDLTLFDKNDMILNIHEPEDSEF
jgi:hypothetical protein